MLSRVHGNVVMTKEDAIEMREHAIKAIVELSQLLNKAKDRCSEGEYQQMKRGVGLSIGRIQTELLDVIYATYPELDDLK
jgi:hypothetical protein